MGALHHRRRSMLIWAFFSPTCQEARVGSSPIGWPAALCRLDRRLHWEVSYWPAKDTSCLIFRNLFPTKCCKNLWGIKVVSQACIRLLMFLGLGGSRSLWHFLTCDWKVSKFTLLTFKAPKFLLIGMSAKTFSLWSSPQFNSNIFQ